MNNILFKTVMLKGDKGNPGSDGAQIESIEKTSTVGLIDTYTITLSDGTTTTFEIKNGENAQLYEIPQGSIIAYDGETSTETETSDNSNEIEITSVNKINSISINGVTNQSNYTGKNLFAGTDWVNGYFRNDGVYIPKTTGGNDTACTTFNKIDPSDSCAISWGGWSVKIPSEMYIFAYSSNTENSFLGKTTINLHVGDTYKIYDNPYNADYIRIYFHGAGSYSQYIPVNFQIEKGTTATSYEPYCGGVPTPSPAAPQDINGVGELQNDDTYSFDVTATDGVNTYTITVSNLTAPIYAGDVINVLDGSITRYNGFKIFDGSENWAVDSNASGYSLNVDDMETSDFASGNANRFGTISASTTDNNKIRFGANDSSIYLYYVNISGVSDLSTFKTYLENNKTYIVYPLAAAATETATITGDINAIKNIIGDTVTVTAPAIVNTFTVVFGRDTLNPDGYETYDAQWDTEINGASNWAPETRAVFDEFYFKNGDVLITGDGVDNPRPLLNGYYNGYGYHFALQLPKRLQNNQTVTVEQLSGLQIYKSDGDSIYIYPGNEITVNIIRELNQLDIYLHSTMADPQAKGICSGGGELKITIVEEVNA